MQSLLEIERPAESVELTAVQSIERPGSKSVIWDPSANELSVGGGAVWTATGHERPVFLDEHGRRRRWVWLAGATAGGASAFWLAALVAGAIGFSTMPAMRSGAGLLASRASHASVRPPADAHRRSVSHARGSSAPGGGTELAVSRALIAAR